MLPPAAAQTVEQDIKQIQTITIPDLAQQQEGAKRSSSSLTREVLQIETELEAIQDELTSSEELRTVCEDIDQLSKASAFSLPLGNQCVKSLAIVAEPFWGSK